MGKFVETHTRDENGEVTNSITGIEKILENALRPKDTAPLSDEACMPLGFRMLQEEPGNIDIQMELAARRRRLQSIPGNIESLDALG